MKDLTDPRLRKTTKISRIKIRQNDGAVVMRILELLIMVAFVTDARNASSVFIRHAIMFVVCV